MYHFLKTKKALLNSVKGIKKINLVNRNFLFIFAYLQKSGDFNQCKFVLYLMLGNRLKFSIVYSMLGDMDFSLKSIL